MKGLGFALAVTGSLVLLLAQVVGAQDASPSLSAGGSGGQFNPPPNLLPVSLGGRALR